MNPLNFFTYLPHYLRKKFKEKYIIIESDDWGLERALNEDSINWLKRKYGIDKLSRWSTDSLETKEDLNELFGLLENYKQKFEFPPVITANFITHNIDYSSKEDLRFRPLSEGFNEDSEDVRELYKKGIEKNLIFPQLHGYSHYNLTDLRKYFLTEEGKKSFNENFFAAKSTIRGNLSFLQGELSIKNGEKEKLNEAVKEFRFFLGFSSKTIIPPTFIFDTELTGILKKNNISMVQSSNRLVSSEKKNMGFPYFQRRKGLYWSLRNARLDPEREYNFYYEQCIDSILKAFENKSPAIIDFHRVNFAGRYTPEYRSETIRELKLLFDKIHDKWPDAKFINSQKLNDILWQQETR